MMYYELKKIHNKQKCLNKKNKKDRKQLQHTYHIFASVLFKKDQE